MRKLYKELGVLSALTIMCSAVYAADTVKIGLPVGLSGANSVVAPSVVQSAELAVEEINKQGGILGREVELVIADDGSGAVGAQKAFDALIFDKKVDVIISMETSSARNAALPIVSKSKVPYIYTSFYEGNSCNKWMYCSGWVPEQLSSSIVDYFNEEKGAKKYFLIGSDYAFGRGVLEFTRQYIEKSGGEVVGEEYLPVDGSDWTAIISKLKDASPDALISCTAGGSPNVTLGKQLKSAGVSIPYGNLAIDEGTAKDMGSVAAGMYMSASYMTSINSPENSKYLESMKAKFGDQMKTPNDLSVPEYEAIYTYKAAVEKAQSFKNTDVIKALGEVAVTGPRGTIKIDGESRHADLTMYLGQVMEDGSVKIIKSFPNVSPGKQCRK